MSVPPSGNGRYADPSHLAAGWYWETDSSHRLVHVEPAALAGPAPEQALGLPRWELPGPEAPDSSRWQAHQALLARREAFHDFPLDLRDARGRLRHLLISGEPVFDAAGAFTGYRGVGQDVTAPRRAKRALLAGPAGLSAAIQAAADAVMVVDGYQSIMVFNTSAVRMFGCDRTEALYSPLARFFPEYRLDADAASMPPQATTALRSDGHGFPAELSATRIEARGQVLFLLLVRDHTARALAERQRSLQEAQAHDAKRAEALATMSGGIAHDINNIVAAVLGNAALARERLADPQALAECLEQITQAGLRGREMAQRILAFVRRPAPVFRTLTLQAVVTDAVRQLRAVLPPGQRISHRAIKTPLPVHADAAQIAQVVMNLGTNAWQALNGRQGLIRILVDRQGAQARLQVCDDGQGMDSNTVQHVFEPLGGAHAAGEGSGLGMAVVHGIVRAHGGRIDVYSAPGQGATFEIFLPLATAPQPSHAPVDAPAPPAAPVRRKTAPHIVYLDDYPAMVLMVRAVLQARGWRVTGLEDAREALAFIRANAHDIDLVVSDYNMPEHSGLEVAREVQRLRPGLPVVLASGCLTDELRAGAADAGVRALFDKPRGVDEMCNLIAGILGCAVPEPAALTV